MHLCHPSEKRGAAFIRNTCTLAGRRDIILFLIYTHIMYVCKYACLHVLYMHINLYTVRFLNDGNESGSVSKLSVWSKHMFWYHHQRNSVFECVCLSRMMLEHMRESCCFCTFLSLKILSWKNVFGNNERTRILQSLSHLFFFQPNVN